jgi:catalase
MDDKAVIVNGKASEFKKAIQQHRNWDRREVAERVPA